MTIIPDGIEPVEGWRRWDFNGNGLASVNDGITWPAQERFEARCTIAYHRTTLPQIRRYAWEAVQGGMSPEQCEQHIAELEDDKWWAEWCQIIGPTPQIALPSGWGWSLLPVEQLSALRHDAPDEACSCGIYAATQLSGCPLGPPIFGKVKFWGKIVPGERGWRAQYAYPSELYVPCDLVEHPGLLAYGVPLIPYEREPEPRPFGDSVGLRIAIVANMLACGVNVALIVFRFWA